MLAQSAAGVAGGRLDQTLDVPAVEPGGTRRDTKSWPSPHVSPFLNAGLMWRGEVWTRKVKPNFDGKFQNLGEVLVPDEEVPESFFIPSPRCLSGNTSRVRSQKTGQANGHEYKYQEGGIAFPDRVDQPVAHDPHRRRGLHSLTFQARDRGEDGRYRRLTPLELERLNGFADDWTKTGMSDGRRAFMMGNALIVGLVQEVGTAISRADSG